jgi:mono/diheme cytochrome c family protein
MLLAGVLLLSPCQVQAGGRPKCLHCHPLHYAERGSCTGCHKGDSRSDRAAIAHRDLIRGRYSWYAIAGAPPLIRGEKLAEQLACRRCHTLAGRGNRLASNLDRVAAGSSPEQISHTLKAPASYMPQFRLTDRQLVDLVTVILAAGAHAAPQKGESPQVVHFGANKRRVENVFAQKCGPCHKALTAGQGALGRGDIGPNLSGLLTECYPPTARSGTRWTRDALKKWLENPRTQRPQSQMRPVVLSKEEFDQLLVTLAVN